MSFDLGNISIGNDVLEEGVWVDFYEGARLKVASLDSETYNSFISRLANNHRLTLRDDNPKNYQLNLRLTCEARAKHILLDWEGIKINGKETKYTPEIGEKALLGSARLRAFVEDSGNDYTRFKAKTVEQVKES